jgi:hypothetical protein
MLAPSYCTSNGNTMTKATSTYVGAPLPPSGVGLVERLFSFVGTNSKFHESLRLRSCQECETSPAKSIRLRQLSAPKINPADAERITMLRM